MWLLFLALCIPWDVLCIYVQEERVGKWPCLCCLEYVLTFFLRDFILGTADRSSFWDAFRRIYDVIEVTVIYSDVPLKVVGVVEILVDIKYWYFYVRHCGDYVTEFIFEPHVLYDLYQTRTEQERYVRQSPLRQRYQFQSDGRFLNMYFFQRMHKYNVKGNGWSLQSGMCCQIVAWGDPEFVGGGQNKFHQTFVPNCIVSCLRRLYDINRCWDPKISQKYLNHEAYIVPLAVPLILLFCNMFCYEVGCFLTVNYSQVPNHIPVLNSFLQTLCFN